MNILMGLLEIIPYGKKFLLEKYEDSNHAHRSWEHCFKSFQIARLNDDYTNNKNKLCLELAFFLASWGMYRGSSFLVKKDYLVHQGVIDCIFKEEYRDLWSIPIEHIDKAACDMIMSLRDEIENEYNRVRNRTNGVISDVLITKVLMGTMGCVPAYDRYFIEGLKKCNIRPLHFSTKSLAAIVSTFYPYGNELRKLKEPIYLDEKDEWHDDNHYYPDMKLIDMCIWQIGFVSEFQGFKK